MIKCPVCEAPFGRFEITNTTITLLVRCGCTATIRVHPDGRTGVVARLRRPDFVKGTDSERLQEMFEIRRTLLDRIEHATDLLGLINTERNRVGLKVRKAAVEEMVLMQQSVKAERIASTVDQKALFKHLYRTLGKDVVDAMIAEASS